MNHALKLLKLPALTVDLLQESGVILLRIKQKIISKGYQKSPSSILAY